MFGLFQRNLFFLPCDKKGSNCDFNSGTTTLTYPTSIPCAPRSPAFPSGPDGPTLPSFPREPSSPGPPCKPYKKATKNSIYFIYIWLIKEKLQ